MLYFFLVMQLTPSVSNKFIMVLTSDRGGMFVKYNPSEDKRDAANMGNAAFFAPDIVTIPWTC